MFAALYQVMNATVGLRKKIWISDKSSQKESLNIYIYVHIYMYILNWMSGYFLKIHPT